jgi:predicted GNAT family acetyltransferase
LERCHAQLVYDQWPYRAGSTVEKVAEEIQELPSAGVFLKDNDKLVSWMMYHPPNGMSRLHTLQEYRRRGYAALVTQYLSKRVAQCGFVPFVNIDLENIASSTLFTSTLGFQRLCLGHCYVTSNYPS